MNEREEKVAGGRRSKQHNEDGMTKKKLYSIM